MPRLPALKNATDVARFLADETRILDAQAKMTDKQREALVRICDGPVSLWEFGSTTINRLRLAGYIVTIGGFAQATQAGREAVGK